MKEYRIKARSAEHRRAIIGALEGMGFEWPESIKDGKDDMLYPTIFVLEWGRITGSCTNDPPTHTSLDSLLEDIERDRRTVEVTCSGLFVRVHPDRVTIGDVYTLAHEDIDAIAAAVKQVRGE